MAKVVLDSTILVSAFLKPVPGGASFEILRLAAAGAFELFLSRDILEETERVLRTSTHIRRRYSYSDDAIMLYCRSVAALGKVIVKVPAIRIVRDPADDVILACAVAAGADYLITRDRDLLSLDRYGKIDMTAPEEFLSMLRDI